MSAPLMHLRAAMVTAAVCLVLAQSSWAAITTTGSVVPDPNTTDLYDDLYIGNSADGTMQVDNGSDVASLSGYLGQHDGLTGSVTITGSGSTWNSGSNMYVGYGGSGVLEVCDGGQVDDFTARLGYGLGSTGSVTVAGDESAWNYFGALYVGDSGAGTLHISDGGRVSSGEGFIGNNVGSAGTVTVNGPDSSWDNHYYLRVGQVGSGTLSVTNGATVSCARGHIGGGEGSTAAVSIDGGGSAWDSGFSLFIDHNGGLAITRGGTVTSDRVTAGGLVTIDGAESTCTANSGLWVHGQAKIARGGTLDSAYAYIGDLEAAVTVDGNGSTWTNTGDLWVGADGDGTLTITGGGVVDVVEHGFVYLGYGAGATGTITVDGPGSTLRCDAALRAGYQSTGTLWIIGGGTVDVGGVALEDGGTLHLRDGVLRTHSVAGPGTLDFTGGRLEGPSWIDLDGPFVQDGGTFSPCDGVDFVSIENGYTLNKGVLEIQIIDGPYRRENDEVEVYGPVDLVGDDGLLNGVLKVDLDVYPYVNEEFTIVWNESPDPVIGMFDNGVTVKAPYGSRLFEFAIDYAGGDGNDIVLTRKSVGVLGDYNGDGIIDAADYTVWHDALGDVVAPFFGADGNGDGIVNEADHAVWKAMYGHTSGGNFAMGQGAAVPEPAGVVLMVLGAAAVGAAARRR